MLTEGKTKGGMSPKKQSTSERPIHPPPPRSPSGDLLSDITVYFKELRFNKNHHLGLGDIRLTIGQQEEILQIISKATNKKFTGI